VIALGDAELADGTATVRDMASRSEVKVPIAELAAALARAQGSPSSENANG